MQAYTLIPGRRVGFLGAISALALFAGSLFVSGMPSAEAARGGGTYVPASIVLNSTDPHLGDVVTFSTSGGKRIAVACYQGGVTQMVWSADQSVGTSFLLGGTSSVWLSNGGAASCTAWLYTRSLTRDMVAQVNFTAQGAR